MNNVRQSENLGMAAWVQSVHAAAYLLKHTNGVVGFFGASSMERLPIETVKQFKALPI